MYIGFVPNRGSKPAILLRESIREGKRIKKRSAPLIVGKHFDPDSQDSALAFSVNEARVAAEAALDGLYVIRTAVTKRT
jgi:hypothetical protein